MPRLARITINTEPAGHAPPATAGVWSPPHILSSLSQDEARTVELPHVDLMAYPPDATLIARFGASNCLRAGLLPWRRRGGATIILSARPGQMRRHLDALTAAFGPVRMAYAPEGQMQAALLSVASGELVTEAETRVHVRQSCRTFKFHMSARTLVVLTATGVVIGLLPLTALTLLLGWAILCMVAGLALKLAAIGGTWHPPVAPPRNAVPARLPVVSILVPLYRESEIAAHLLPRMAALDYPRDLLDLCFILEDDDLQTRTALSSVNLPSWVQVIEVPQGTLRTKPRALNFALNFARGAIIGIYDAEDMPGPDHIRRIVQRFSQRGPDVGCLQGVLDYFNPRANWLARCFTLEYAAWFRVVLPGLDRLGLVVPLGGTTLFLRRHAIEQVGGWDAHNVTEDADLGLRLARHGYRTEVIGIVTLEEANAKVWPWIRQRSRWLKGYAVTWLVHMRNPLRLWRDLGTRKFLGMQLLFLGTLTQSVLAPLLWSFWLPVLGIPHPLGAFIPHAAMTSMAALSIIAMGIELALLTLAAFRSGKGDLALWGPTLVLYFPLATLAAWRGLWQIATKPFFWDKTIHGHFAPTIPMSKEEIKVPPEPAPHQVSAA